MTRKTERIFATGALDGNDRLTAGTSLNMALALLEQEGERQGREVLFDTLEVSIDREIDDAGSIASSVPVVTYVFITVSAEAVRR